jgi:hypothetical protein
MPTNSDSMKKKMTKSKFLGAWLLTSFRTILEMTSDLFLPELELSIAA